MIILETLLVKDLNARVILDDGIECIEEKVLILSSVQPELDQYHMVISTFKVNLKKKI